MKKVVRISMVLLAISCGFCQDSRREVVKIIGKEYDSIIRLFTPSMPKIKTPNIDGYKIIVSDIPADPTKSLASDMMNSELFVAVDGKSVFLKKSGGIAAEIVEWFGPITLTHQVQGQ